MKKFTFTTQCNICQNLTNWNFISNPSFTYLRFKDEMESYKIHPQEFDCRDCERQTFQKVFSYCDEKKKPHRNDEALPTN